MESRYSLLLCGFEKSAYFTIYGLAVYLFSHYLNFAYFFSENTDWFYSSHENLPKYDYIVVGAGSAGAVLATRLNEMGFRILLLEAGGTSPYFTDIPVLAPFLQRSVYDWQHATVPQKHACKGLINNQSLWSMGKVIGGSSKLNYMLYVEGHPLDYEDWFPDYKDFTAEKMNLQDVNDIQWYTELSDAVLKGITELNKYICNINKNVATGFMKAQVTIKNGERQGTDKILRNTNRPGLTIFSHSHVNKVIFKSKKAVGIEYTKFGKRMQAYADQGVILSAGAIGSPKLLMLSGIGPKEHLESLNIKVINDLPVGQNLMDHIVTGLDLVTLNTTLSLSLPNLLNPMSAIHYYLFRQGPWTSAGVEVLGTLYSQKNKSTAPDLQFMVMPLGISQDNGIFLKRIMGITDRVYEEYFAPLSHKTAVTILPVLLHPKSKGEIKLRSNNPFDQPIINPKYLSNNDDVYTLINGIQFIKQLINTNAMQALGASLYKKHFPGCEDKTFDSMAYWNCYIRHLTLSSYHPAGTCRINTVVDKSFKVLGTRNLFVVDASVFPKLPSGNINAAVMMIAEKASSLFKIRKQVHESLLFKCQISEVFYPKNKERSK
ncbi:glucose dehydrogenase [FAD, quinone] isoform X2 [Orussus abietinus]|uniref:glucose dehydrogenase [FAD, quinone] isoform X2 n=1 Tax=Orussus abietinus TaxID=222816 RepID=UPI0006257C62|nr:glucose dehydrogenase [FAD, quinone] isoform X2 [Orussus abietinus]